MPPLPTATPLPYAFRGRPASWSSEQESRHYILGRLLERPRFHAVEFVLALFLLTVVNPAFGGNKAPKLAETVDLPSTFDLDFQFAAKQRVQLGGQAEVSDDVAGGVGAEVFQSLVRTEMISGFRLPYTWTFKLYDNPAVNAGSLPDGEVEAYTGLSRLIGTNRGLWAAVLAHEVAHVARRHGIRKYLFHQYIEEQVRYWQLRARLGEKGAGWTALAVRVAGNLAEKKLSRDLEHDADIQGMLLMARAGYHPDNAFAMHHLLRMSTPERSKIGTFFFSDHPRWESRDQRTERAYTEALAEYNRLWVSPDSSPGGAPPAVAFLGEVGGTENKEGGTGDLTLALSCRNVERPVALVIHLTKGNGAPVQSMVSDYRDSAGNMMIRERAACLDVDSAKPTIVHIPTGLISRQDRKLKAQVEVLGPSDEILERSKVFAVHFPKTDKKSATTTTAKVRVDPPLGETPWTEPANEYKVAKVVAPVAIPVEQSRDVAILPTQVEKPRVEALHPSGTHSREPELETQAAPPAQTVLGVLPSALDRSGMPSTWGNALAPAGLSTWWQLSQPAVAAPRMSLSRSVVFFPVQPVGTESGPVSVIITNNAPAALAVSGITIAGNDASDFTQTNDCGSTIATGATCTLWLIFRPTSDGTKTGTLTLDGAAQRITLTGIGK
jgi:hypothetical protein